MRSLNFSLTMLLLLGLSSAQAAQPILKQENLAQSNQQMQNADEITTEEDFLYDTEPFDETALPNTPEPAAKETPDEDAVAVEADPYTEDDYGYGYDSTILTEDEAIEESSIENATPEPVYQASAESADWSPSTAKTNHEHTIKNQAQVALDPNPSLYTSENAPTEEAQAVTKSKKAENMTSHNNNQVAISDPSDPASPPQGYFSRMTHSISSWFSK